MDPAKALRVAAVATLVLLLAAIGVGLAFTRRPKATMGFLAHIDDLRRRILVSVFALLVGIVIALGVAIDWVGPWPVPRFALYDSMASQLFRAVAHDLVPANVRLIVTSPMDGFAAQFTWSVALGALLAMPILLWQIGGFFAPALKPREARWLRLAIVPAVLLFVAGALFAYLEVVPLAMSALYNFSDALGAESLLDVGSFSGFVLGFLAGFGLAFQTPLVMIALSRAGLVAPRTWWKGWRHAIVAIVVIAGVLTPDPTVVSQMLLAVPLLGLYFLGAGLARSPKGS